MPNPYGAPEISVLDLKKKLEEAGAEVEVK